jgi:hypothetical protein
MDIKVTVPVNGTRWEVLIQERDPRDAFVWATLLSEPAICGACQGTDLVWSTRKVKDAKQNATYTYISRQCRKCRAQSDVGEYQTGGFFWKPWRKVQPRVVDAVA